MDHNDILKTKDLFEAGKIVPLRAIYEVKFNPIFKIRENLGVIADNLKKYYNITTISKENNEDVVLLIKENITTYFTFSVFKVIEIITEGEIFNFANMVREIKNVPERVKSYGILGKEMYDLKRIGVRLQFIGSIDKIKSIKNLNKTLILNQEFLNKIGSSEDKLYNFNIKLGPDPSDIKEGSEETIISISGQNINLEFNNGEAYNFKNAALIDCIKGYHYPDKIESKYLFETENFVNDNILPILKGVD
ncbi:MAG: hypothetical protein ABRQ39_31165 [Candidatus Eremiobacterota bacterium]